MSDITPSDAQWAAARAILAWYKGGKATPQVFYLAGYAGVGKSTIYKLVIELLRSECGLRNYITCAFTGKAANVLRRKGNPEAMTIHGAVYIPVEDPLTGKVTFIKNTLGPAALADLIGLDECSMVGDDIGADLMSFGKKILVMGDPGQLPPLSGEGFFTRREPDVFLTEIHRQAADSPIIRLATLARQGEPLPLGSWDGCEVLPMNLTTQKAVYREDTQVIVGVHKVRWAVTQAIRKKRGLEGPVPTPGERIIIRRNNNTLGIFNGSMGTVRKDSAHHADGHLRMWLDMDDLSAPLEKLPVHPFHFNQHFPATRGEKPRIPKSVEEVDWGFALTGHNAQGSEYPHVTIVDDSGAFREDRDKWNYTTLTRASEGLTYLKRVA